MCRSSAMSRTCSRRCCVARRRQCLAGCRGAAAWWEEIEAWRAKQCMKYRMKKSVIMPQYVIEKLYEVTGGKAIVTSDVGQHQMWAAQYYKFDSRVAGSTRAAWAPWGSACLTPWARHCRTRKCRLPASPAKARSRCASRSCRLPSSFACRSRSSTSTTATWEWFGSGRRCSTAVVTRSRTWIRCPTSSSWPRLMATSAFASSGRRMSSRRCAGISSITRTISYSSISSPIRSECLSDGGRRQRPADMILTEDL
jgi:hypothetical protein